MTHKQLRNKVDRIQITGAWHFHWSITPTMGRGWWFVFFLIEEVYSHVQVNTFSELVDDIDENPRCEEWASFGECDRNPKFMLYHCSLACQHRTKKWNAQATIYPSETPPPPPSSHTNLASSSIFESLDAPLNRKLEYLLADTFTEDCRHEVVAALSEHLVKYIGEEPAPFQNYQFNSQCPTKKSKIGLSPPIKADGIRICFLLLIHDNAKQAIRLVNSLQVSSHIS
jgi:hypothetical protein